MPRLLCAKPKPIFQRKDTLSILQWHTIVVNHLPRSSHRSQHSGGSIPNASTCHRVTSSMLASQGSNSGRCPRIDQIAHANDHTSEGKDNGFEGSKCASGGLVHNGVCDTYFSSLAGSKASPKSIRSILASGSLTSSLGFPSHTGTVPWVEVPGGSFWPSNRTTGSVVGGPYFSYSCSSDN